MNGSIKKEMLFFKEQGFFETPKICQDVYKRQISGLYLGRGCFCQRQVLLSFFS